MMLITLSSINSGDGQLNESLTFEDGLVMGHLEN